MWFLCANLVKFTLDIGNVAHTRPRDGYSKCGGGRFAGTHERNVRDDFWNVHEGCAAHRRRDFLKNAHPFCAERRFVILKTGDIPAWMRQLVTYPLPTGSETQVNTVGSCGSPPEAPRRPDWSKRKSNRVPS